MKLDYKLVVAYDDNYGIGLNNSIPWHIPEDLKRFKDLTLNSNIIMGYNTFESIIKRNKKPLPKRNNIILTRKNIKSEYDNCHFFNTVEEILSNYKEAWIIGGEEIYKLFLPFTKKAYITKVKGHFNCDRFFPIKENPNWKLLSKEDYEDYSFIVYDISE